MLTSDCKINLLHCSFTWRNTVPKIVNEFDIHNFNVSSKIQSLVTIKCAHQLYNSTVLQKGADVYTQEIITRARLQKD